MIVTSHIYPKSVNLIYVSNSFISLILNIISIKFLFIYLFIFIYLLQIYNLLHSLQ
jgi:hypothetical protein